MRGEKIGINLKKWDAEIFKIWGVCDRFVSTKIYDCKFRSQIKKIYIYLYFINELYNSMIYDGTCHHKLIIKIKLNCDQILFGRKYLNYIWSQNKKFCCSELISRSTWREKLFFFFSRFMKKIWKKKSEIYNMDKSFLFL
jgi:hypothetical protein